LASQRWKRGGPDRPLGLKHHQSVAPIDEPEKQRQRQPRRGVNAPRLDATLLKQRRLPAEKELLRFDGSPTSERARDEASQVGN
jgi:hypothetical protein